MRAGEIKEGEMFLRAKINMASPNLNMRDPALFRIRKAVHHRTGDKWVIYPMYDYAHCVSDAIEGVTFSICTLEFEDHRPLYNWVLEKLDWPEPRPRQIEFARLNLENTLMSTRQLLRLVTEKYVDGWDDPRLPTLAALRRRGVTPEAIRLFCDRVGVAKKDSWIELEWLEKAIRDDLNCKVKRVMATLDPLKITLKDWPKGETKIIKAPYYPDEPEKMGYRDLFMTREILIERDDFSLDPPENFFRLAKGREARLRWSCYVRCEEVLFGEDGRPSELICSHSDKPTIKSKKRPAILHWVPAERSIPAVVRLYDRLFTVPRPTGDLENELNPESLVEMRNSRLEPSLAGALSGERFQFERLGYFYLEKISDGARLKVFNRVVALKESLADRKSVV
jgi:glutaminyl-tRNA synthetase